MAFLIAAGPPALQQITPRRLRGLQAALAGLLVNLIGLGIGPSAVAVMTDYILRDEGQLGVALAVVLSVTAAITLAAALVGLRFYPKLLSSMPDGLFDIDTPMIKTANP